MQSARYQLAVVVSIALITGLLYSQVCALNCTAYGCLTPASATEQSDQPGHCHEQQSESTPSKSAPSKSAPSRSAPSKHDNSPDCPAHAELSALMSSTIITVGAFTLSLHAHAAMPKIGLITTRSSGGSMLTLDQIPLRAPPAHSILRI